MDIKSVGDRSLMMKFEELIQNRGELWGLEREITLELTDAITVAREEIMRRLEERTEANTVKKENLTKVS